MPRLTYSDPDDGDFHVDKMWVSVKGGPSGEDIAHVLLEDGRRLDVDSSLISYSKY